MSCRDVCLWMDSDYCSNEFYAEQERRAAKPHRCCECHGEIAKGERHHYAAGKTDGCFFDERTCLPCHEIRKTFACEGWIFGELWESIRDQLFGSWDDMKAIDCLARLETQSAIDKMRAEYATYREDCDS